VRVTFRPDTYGQHTLHLTTWPQKAIGRAKLSVNPVAPLFGFGICSLYFPWIGISDR
jgi:hypothetical protein